ncbi:MAG: alginate lyase family protein [Anaerolineae bacterium]|nr:alginate lyase family protein [Anaerolineae bacterium]
MFNKIKQVQKLIQQFGPGWLLRRARYTARMRSGFLTWQMPAYEWDDRPLETWLKPSIPAEADTYFGWRQVNAPKFLFDVLPHFENADDSAVIAEANALLEGEYIYFSSETIKGIFPPDWHWNPLDNSHLPHDKHWSLIPDFGGQDIKYVWEPSRFGMVYTLVRAYARTQNALYAESFWMLVLDWIEKNPPQRGPNWKCGQETSIRLMAWCFGLYAFWDTPQTTAVRVSQLVQAIAAEAERVEQNLGYARSTRSNHGISEAVGLWTVGILFPELTQADHWRELGEHELLKETSFQFLPDGTYSMHSLNYQRMALQAVMWAMRLGEVNNAPLPQWLYARVTSAVDFISQMIEPETGQTPNHGSNDGSLILPLSECDYSDFRPVVQLGHFLCHGRRLLDAGPWDEALLWFGYHGADKAAGLVRRDGAFAEGGYYTQHGEISWAFIHAPVYSERPQHSDQLHVDLWWRGQNIAIDAGTYRYNAPDPWNNALATTAVHNTVMVDGQEHMPRASRFTWLDWAQCEDIHREHDSDGNWSLWQGAHTGYHRHEYRVDHQRSVLQLVQDIWVVIDRMQASAQHDYRLHWLLNDFPYEISENAITLNTPQGSYRLHVGAIDTDVNMSTIRADVDEINGWQSRYYGQKSPAISVAMTCSGKNMTLWSVFAAGDTVVRAHDNNLTIRTESREYQVDLAQSHPIPTINKQVS